jgi:hypothetical protein
MKPTRKDLIAAAADVYDCGKDRAERDLIAIDWWICQRMRYWLRRHGFAV